MEKIWNEINCLEEENKIRKAANKWIQKAINKREKTIADNNKSIKKNNQRISELLKLLEKKGGKK